MARKIKMGKNSFNEIWIDGFNLFYKWKKTNLFFRPGCDIKTTQQKSLELLAKALNNNCKRTIVFMDGGIERTSITYNGMRIKFPGSGKKADELLEEQARGKQNNKKIIAVTSDRYLAATLRRYRLKIIDSAKFIRNFLNNTSEKNNYTDHKPEVLTKEEVEEWLDIFSQDK